MDIISAYRQVGSYRAAAELCGTTHKTVKSVGRAKLEAGEPPQPGVERAAQLRCGGATSSPSG